MNELRKPIKGENSKPMNESIREEIFSKIYDSSDYLLDNHALLPKSIKVKNETIDLKLNKQDIAKLKNIIWYISHSKLWK